jgi:hypothetical protein
VKNETGHTNVEWETTTRSITVRFLCAHCCRHAQSGASVRCTAQRCTAECLRACSCDENESADIESILRMARRLTTTEPEM